MKWSIIIILPIFLLNLNNCKFNNVDTISNFNLDSEDIQYKDPVEKTMSEIIEYIFNMVFEGISGGVTEEFLEEIYNLFDYVDQDCVDFIVDFLIDGKKFLNKITKKLLRDGGLIQYSLGVEDDCLNEDGVYFFFTGPNNFTLFRERKSSQDEEQIFKENFYTREEVCVFKECNNLYKPLIEFLLKNNPEMMRTVFQWNNFTLSGINFNGITEEEKIKKSDSEKEKQNEEDNYYDNIIIVFKILGVFFALCLIVTWIIRKNNKTIETQLINPTTENISLKEDSQQRAKSGGEITNTLTAKDLKYEDLTCFKIISSFDFLNNFALLNQKKEPLSDQTSLIELSTIKIIILFLILSGENTYIILKYIDNKVSIFSFCKRLSFLYTKLATNSYEFYKVIGGVIFGYKFINYYNKSEAFNAKRILRFAIKPIPYILVFLIIHFLFNYPIFIFARKFFGNFRNNFISSNLCQYTCQENPIYIISKMISIMGEYKTIGFNIWQYTGCVRPILFTFSELFCFYLVLILTVVHICFKNKVINIIYFIFFLCNFVFLCLTYFISKEVKDLNGEYTISRLFGLSGSLAITHLFFPLYYIGFNIGIIYYYHLNELSNKLIAEKEAKIFIPFQYCNQISTFITRISDVYKNIFMLIFFILILVFSSMYTIIENNLNETEIIFTFEEHPFSKFIFTYEGIIVGLLFSFFILFYLCLNTNGFLRNILSSEFFIFSHKISFVVFITFISVLNFFHIIGLMEINLGNFPIFLNSITLFIVTCLISIIFTCLFLFPVKWINFFIFNGINTEEYKENLII